MIDVRSGAMDGRVDGQRIVTDDERTVEETNGRADGQRYGRADGLREVLTFGLTGERTDGRRDGRTTDGETGEPGGHGQKIYRGGIGYWLSLL